MNDFTSKVLVEESGLGKTIFSIHQQFALIEFFDFCTFLESIVLNDKLVMISQYSKEQYEKSKLEVDGKHRRFTGNDHIFDLLEKHDVLERSWINPPRIRRGDGPPRNITESEEARLLSQLSYVRHDPRNKMKTKHLVDVIGDSWFETQRILNGERELNVSALSFVRQQPYYVNEGRVRESHTYCDLIAQYSDLSDALIQSRKINNLNFTNYYSLPVPPVALLLLQRAKSMDQMLEVCLELRNDFTKLRNKLTEIRSILANPSVSPKEKKKIRKSWMKSWATLSRYKEHDNFVYVADTTHGYVNYDKSLDGIGLDSLSVTKLIGKAIELGEKEMYKWRIRILHSTAKKYLKTSDSEINSHLRRLYRYEINNHDVDILKRVGFLE